MLILGIILCVIGLAAAIFFFYKTKHQIEKDNLIIEQNKKEQEKLKEIQNEIDKKANEVTSLNQQIDIYKNYQENNEEIMKQSYERYYETLEKDYLEKEKEYEQYCLALKVSYDTLQDNAIKAADEQKAELSEQFKIQSEEVKKQLDAAIEELNRVQATRAAAIEAQKRENEIKQKIDFYCLHLTETDQKTIEMINELKPRLPDPRILSMLVWQTFFQKQMNTLCANVLGTEKICGIYKITNQIDGLCYIGQAVNYRPMKNFS